MILSRMLNGMWLAEVWFMRTRIVAAENTIEEAIDVCLARIEQHFYQTEKQRHESTH